MRGPLIILPAMILVHAVDDRAVAVNTDHIVSFAPPRDLVTPKAHCLISLADRKFITTSETCDEVGDLWQREDAKEK